MPKIIPTIGRVMLYHPKEQQGLVQYDTSKPLMAHVCHVWNDDLVNLDVIDSTGRHHIRTSVPVVQEGSPYTAGTSPYAQWMPYQVEQAAKHQAPAPVTESNPA